MRKGVQVWDGDGVNPVPQPDRGVRLTSPDPFENPWDLTAGQSDLPIPQTGKCSLFIEDDISIDVSQQNRSLSVSFSDGVKFKFDAAVKINDYNYLTEWIHSVNHYLNASSYKHHCRIQIENQQNCYFLKGSWLKALIVEKQSMYLTNIHCILIADQIIDHSCP